MDDRIRMLTVTDLWRMFGATEAWWSRHRAELVAAGALAKRGRKFFGSPARIAAWLEGRDVEAAAP